MTAQLVFDLELRPKEARRQVLLRGSSINFKRYAGADGWKNNENISLKHLTRPLESLTPGTLHFFTLRHARLELGKKFQVGVGQKKCGNIIVHV